MKFVGKAPVLSAPIYLMNVFGREMGVVSALLDIREEAGLIFGPHTRRFGKCCCCTLKINHDYTRDS
jgi:hypothetical protein